MSEWHSGYGFDMPMPPKAPVFSALGTCSLAESDSIYIGKDVHLENQPASSRQISEWHVK